MNLLAALAGVVTLAAFGAHAVVGAREFALFAPDPEAGAARTAWVQSLAGWHWVSVTLLGAGLAFLVVALTDWVPAESAVLRGLGAYFAVCGAAWALTVAVSGRGGGRRFVVLGQWAFCFLVAALAFGAA